jgi:hypothetical protein
MATPLSAWAGRLLKAYRSAIAPQYRAQYRALGELHHG